jgi:hypothetical protein
MALGSNEGSERPLGTEAAARGASDMLGYLHHAGFLRETGPKHLFDKARLIFEAVPYIVHPKLRRYKILG